MLGTIKAQSQLESSQSLFEIRVTTSSGARKFLWRMGNIDFLRPRRQTIILLNFFAYLRFLWFHLMLGKDVMYSNNYFPHCLLKHFKFTAANMFPITCWNILTCSKYFPHCLLRHFQIFSPLPSETFLHAAHTSIFLIACWKTFKCSTHFPNCLLNHIYSCAENSLLKPTAFFFLSVCWNSFDSTYFPH